MAHDTRQRICDTAVRLFNERGYGEVSLRQIAAAAGTTIGNLTYHFSKKDDLLQTILVDLHGAYSNQFVSGLRGADLVHHLVDLIVLGEANQHNYQFYFKNISQILSQSPALAEEGRRFSGDLYRYYRDQLDELLREGWMRGDLGTQAMDVLAQCIVQMESTWAESHVAVNRELPRTAASQAICSLMASHITPDRLAEFRSICLVCGVEA